MATIQKLKTFDLHDVPTSVNIIASILRRAGYRNIVRNELNHKKHWTVTAVNPKTGKEKKFYIKWEDRLFEKAGKGLVPEITGTKGALTINVEYAQEAKKVKDTTILFPQKVDGMIYEVDAEFFWNHSYDYPHTFEDEIVRCIAIENVEPWGLAQQYTSAQEQMLEQQEQQPSLKKGEETILILKCVGTLKDGTPCGYARVQTKQDIHAIELKMLRDCHSKTFNHKMKGLRLPRSHPLAQELRKRLQHYERW